MSGYIEEKEWLEDTFVRELNFEEWVEKEWVEVEITKLVEPLEITHSEELCYTTPMKTVMSQNHEMWGKILPNNNLMEIFGPAFCSTVGGDKRTVLQAWVWHHHILTEETTRTRTVCTTRAVTNPNTKAIPKSKANPKPPYVGI
jgi:hypothetical protein